MQPGRSEAMKSRRLKRRVYSVRGPNQIWHADGNDKLKTYGLYVHGAIDGWSRKLMWLRVASTNRQPAVVCGYYMSALEDNGIMPRTVRVDKGSENGLMADCQTLLQQANPCRNPPVLFGSSVQNIRIEKFWSTYKLQFVLDYCEVMQDLADRGILDASDPFNIELVQFCFIPCLQKEIEMYRRHWNEHRVRKMKSVEIPSGIPDYLFDNPEQLGGIDMSLPYDPDTAAYINREYVAQPPTFGCSDHTAVLLLELMLLKKWKLSSNLDEALTLYGELYIYMYL